MALARVSQALDLVVEASPDLAALRERALALAGRLEEFSAPPEGGNVRWLEAGLRLRLVESPLQIADALRSRVAGDGGMGEGRKSWVFTSATLGHEAGLKWFLASTGLEGARVLQVASPFNYLQQAALYVPKIFPKPSEPQHSDYVAGLVAPAATILGGRTLVLTTTLRAMRRIGQRLREHLASSSTVQVLVQGDGPKRELIDRFALASDAMGCILVASASFWEGVDVPGAALQLVVIDKIPFAPPDDPLVEARCQALEEEGKSAFAHYQLPQAAVALKQGVGRLIRRETDRGVLVLCDVRLSQMGYGRKLLASLPPMRRLDSAEAFQRALQDLTKSSTTDPY
jgi:ATP-dependent DNA helicase DinG